MKWTQLIGLVTGALLVGGAASAQNGSVGPDGLTDRERAEIYGDGPGIQAVTNRDIIIADATSRNVYFGMYRLSQMTDPGWDLFEQSVDWVNDFGDPASTNVWLATYNGTLDPDISAEKDGIAAYEYLIDTMGFLDTNIHVAHQSSIETGDFTGYDIVIYAWVYPRDATNVLDQNKPYLTVAAGQTDELGIGTGVEIMHESRDTAYVANADEYIGSTFGLGSFTLVSNMYMDATEATGNGIPIVVADETCLILNVDNLVAGGRATFRVYGPPDGNVVAIVYGTVDGSTPINGYANYCVNFDIANVNQSKLVASGAVNGGVYEVRRNIPSGVAGLEVLLQAAQRGTCPNECKSNLMRRTIL